MPLIINIDSESANLELPDSTIKHYKFDFAEGNNYAKGTITIVKLSITIDIKGILNLSVALEDKLKLIQDLRDWSECLCISDESSKEYYRKLTLKNYFGHEEVRLLTLSHAYIDQAVESVDFLNGKHTITLKLLQKEDMLDYVEQQ